MGHYFAPDGTPFCTGWDTIWDTILTDGTPNGTLFCPDGTPNGTRTDTILQKWDTNGHQWTPFWCPMRLWSSVRPVEGYPCSFWRPGGCKIGLGSHKRTRSRFAILAGCGILVTTGFQSCKGGDMVCVRGPLGAFCLYRIWNSSIWNRSSGPILAFALSSTSLSCRLSSPQFPSQPRRQLLQRSGQGCAAVHDLPGRIHHPKGSLVVTRCSSDGHDSSASTRG